MDDFRNNNENQENKQDNENLWETKPIDEPQHHASQNTYHAPNQRAEHYRRPSGLSYLATGLIGALIGGFIMAAITPTFLYGKVIPYPQQKQSDNAQLGQQIVIKTEDQTTVASAVAKKVTPAVVGISTVSLQRDIFGVVRQSEGVGSGFVVNPNGFIVTNAHVVGDNPRELTIYFKDGKEMPGQVLWQDTTLDMAIVKVDATNLPSVELGDSDSIEIGETAIAIGNPLGLRYERTVTQGIISGLNRSLLVSQTDIMEDLIQTDAAINPGNSGGPLINSKGQIIGINTAKASAEGLGFAIPINIAKPIVNRLVNEGEFRATYIGIGLLDREIAGYMDTDIQIKSGIYITSVMQGHPAEQAGLRPEDIITHVDGIEVNTMLKFKAVLYSHRPGDVVKVTYLRDNATYETNITLMERPRE